MVAVVLGSVAVDLGGGTTVLIDQRSKRENRLLASVTIVVHGKDARHFRSCAFGR
jgi:hypothetical protein